MADTHTTRVRWQTCSCLEGEMIFCLATDLSAAVNEPCQVIGAANPFEVAFRRLHKLMEECKVLGSAHIVVVWLLQMNCT